MREEVTTEDVVYVFVAEKPGALNGWDRWPYSDLETLRASIAPLGIKGRTYKVTTRIVRIEEEVIDG